MFEPLPYHTSVLWILAVYMSVWIYFMSIWHVWFVVMWSRRFRSRLKKWSDIDDHPLHTRLDIKGWVSHLWCNCSNRTNGKTWKHGIIYMLAFSCHSNGAWFINLHNSKGVLIQQHSRNSWSMSLAKLFGQFHFWAC
jgi:hypothetical protein